MCLPSSLLKAGSQLHSFRDSKEAEGPSLVHSKAELCWPPAWQGLCLPVQTWGGERRGSGEDPLLCPTPPTSCGQRIFLLWREAAGGQ